jgi:hypothetical protein
LEYYDQLIADKIDFLKKLLVLKLSAIKRANHIEKDEKCEDIDHEKKH